jgi:hypothetical protein
MDQNERLNYLVEQFRKDSLQYRNLEIPPDPAGRKRILRSLMNIRMLGMMPPEVLAVQDAYLQERNRENGIVQIEDIPTIACRGSRHAQADRISIWQGGMYYKACRRRDCECCQFPDAGMLRPHAYLH